MSIRFRIRSKLPRSALVALAAFILACAPGAEEGIPDAGPATDDLLALLPADSVVVGWMDLDAVRESSSGAALFDQDPAPPGQDGHEELQRLAEATGIEMQDIHSGAFAVPGGTLQEDEPVAVAIAKVDYEPARMTETLATRPTLSYRDRTLYELDESMWNDRDEQGASEEPAGQETGEAAGGQEAAGDEQATEEEEDDDPPYLVMLDAGTLVLGNERGVRAALDTIAGEADSLRDNADMIEVIDGAAVASQAWLVVSREAWSQQLEDLPEGRMPVARSAIEGLERMTVSLGVDDGFMLRLTAVAGSEDDAGDLADALRGVVAMGKMMIQQEPELFAILDEGIDVGAEGREIRLEARLTDAQVEVLRQYAEERMPARQGSSGS